MTLKELWEISCGSAVATFDILICLKMTASINLEAVV